MDPPPAWSRAELNDLRKEYREYSQRSLDKCDSYLNFYVGLLAALLAATLTGLLQVEQGDARAWLLLTGPAAALALARLGYKTFVVFYSRFVEAWVTETNLQAMLGTEHLGEPDSICQRQPKTDQKPPCRTVVSIQLPSTPLAHLLFGVEGAYG